MKKLLRISFAIILLAIAAIAIHLYWLASFNAKERFPADQFLDNSPNKSALIIVAHDDDAMGCAGTIAELTKKGWQVHLLTFYGHWRSEDNATRKKEVAKASGILRLSGTDLIDFSIQRSDTVKEPWRPIPYAQFAAYFQTDSLQSLIATAISQYKPSVIFTLDNIIGGYGHPEHVCVSQTVLDVCNNKKSTQGFSVQKIYQAVFTRTHNERVLHNNPAFIAAKEIYQADGSPIPNIEIDIRNSSADKKAAMMAFASQKRNMVKIWPYYNVYPSWLYFKVFDKEYFNVITIRND